MTKAASSSIFDQHDLDTMEDFTPITCLDCGGSWRRTVEHANGRHYTEYCRYCVRGGMNEERQKSWRVDKQKRRVEHLLTDYLTPEEAPRATATQTGARKKQGIP